MQNKSQENKLKSNKSPSNFNPTHIIKNVSRKKTLSSKQKSHNKKTRKPLLKDKKMQIGKEYKVDGQQNFMQRNQYYTKEKHYDHHKSFSENISEHTLNVNKKYSEDQTYHNFDNNEACSQYGTSPKIRLDSIKGVISFQGKLVKNQLKAQVQDKQKNYTRWDTNSRDLTGQLMTDRHLSRISKSQKKGCKSKSKSKNLKRPQNKSKSRIIQNIPDFLTQKQAEEYRNHKKTANKQLNFQNNRHKTSRDHESEQTICTPNLNQYQRNQQIDFLPLKVQIEAQQKWTEKHKSNLISMKKILYQQRCTCIQMISKICGEMVYKKETFGLAILIFDMYLNDQVLFRKMKILALSCLQLALKLQQAENAHTFILQINSVCKKNKGTNTVERSTSENKDMKETKRSNNTRQKSKKKGMKKKTVQDFKAQEYFKKQKLFRQIIRQQIPQQQLNRIQMLQFQTLMALKFQFKIWKKTFAYWIDMLTLIWDQFLLNDNQFYHNTDPIVFRCPNNPKNISYLVQIMQSCLYSPSVYQYSKTLLVLSVMYMLVRINMEGGDQSSYSNYKNTLNKSSNVLFIDRVGCNVLFGTFLLKLQIEMGAILSCCQFISNYLDVQPLCIFPYSSKPSVQHYDQCLSYHCYNPNIYRIYAK